MQIIYIPKNFPQDAKYDALKQFRFQDNDELKYSLRSVQMFAPWVRNIFIVTNGQLPPWLNVSHPKVRIITHEVVFTDKSHLPTFSSFAIECHLSKIPNLSEYFIYMNDDFFFGNTVQPTDFMCGNTHKVRLAWKAPRREEQKANSKTDTYGNSLMYTGELLDERYGKQERYVIAHAPYFFKKSVLEKVLALWKQQFEETSSHKFRTNSDMLLAFTLDFFEIYSKIAHPTPFQLLLLPYERDEQVLLSLSTFRCFRRES